ncbi:MAG: hypothetical protein NTY46_01375 [Candidatus Sumerlaeota bacterium]|nr:hypothetical protein [Candidatus Sumerlaeota bacterium]
MNTAENPCKWSNAIACACCAAWLCLCVNGQPASSPASLAAASQAGLESSCSVTLIYSLALDASTAGNTSNYRFTPARSIIRAMLDADSPNIVRLDLAASNPLATGTNYRVETLGGRDSAGRSLVPALTSGSLAGHSLPGEIAAILNAQLSDGMITMRGPGRAWRNGDPIWTVPYFSCYAAQGLISAYTMTRDASLLDPVRRCLDWHANHLKADGTITDYTGNYPNYSSTGDADSEDSYAAMFAWTLWEYYKETLDSGYVAAKMPAVRKVAAVMDGLIQPDGLTWAKSSYLMKYTMDNAEVFQGYYAAAQLADVAGDDAAHSAWLAQADRVRNAVMSWLYVSGASGERYAVALDGAGSVYKPWGNYYPDAMANEFGIYFLHNPAEARFRNAWSAEKSVFFPGNIPPEGVSWTAALAAARLGDRPAFTAAFAGAMRNHEITPWAHDSGWLIHTHLVSSPVTAFVPALGASETITVDGRLDEPAWKRAAKLRFNRRGLYAGCQNRAVYDYPGNTIDPDGLATVLLINKGMKLYAGLDMRDAYLTSAGARGDSDGISFLAIRDAVTTSLVRTLGYTFYPGNGVATVPTATPGGMLDDPSAASAAWSFKSGNNTVNNPADTDTGFQIELLIDLRRPAAGSYPEGSSEIVMGLRIADMDGTSDKPWPWQGGAYGTMCQLSDGLYPADYTVDVIRLLDPASHESMARDWALY